MYDSQLSDLDDIPADGAAEASAALAEVLARKPAGKAPKPPQHPKYQFRAAIQASRELKGATKLVGLLLADFVNVKDGYAYPTAAEIMDKLGMPETTVHRALRNLQDRKAEDGTPLPGWFRREAMKSKNGGDARNHWFPIYARAGIADGTPENDAGGCQNDRGEGATSGTGRVPSTAPLILTEYSPFPVMGEGPKNPSDSAAGQQQGGPGFASRMKNTPKATRKPVEAIALPAGCPFDTQDIARRPDLTPDDIAAAEVIFRETTAGDTRTPAKWKRNAKSWLRRQEPAATRASTAGTLLPEQFTVDDGMWLEAKAFGLTDPEVTEATKRFVDHHRSITGRDATSRDWRLKWRNWMRGAADRKKPRFSKPPSAV